MNSDLLTRFTTALADRYKVEREIGAGGMATVFLAGDIKHHRQVAIRIAGEEYGAESRLRRPLFLGSDGSTLGSMECDRMRGRARG